MASRLRHHAARRGTATRGDLRRDGFSPDEIASHITAARQAAGPLVDAGAVPPFRTIGDVARQLVIELAAQRGEPIR